MDETQPTAEEIALASKVAAADQEMAAWVYDAERLSAFYRILIENSVPEPVANAMLLNAQVRMYEDDDYFSIDPDDDDA